MRHHSLIRLGGLATLLIALFAAGAASTTRQAEADVPGPITDRVMDIMEPALANGGFSAMYLKEIGGSVIAGENEGDIIEPASALKVLIHLYTVKQVQDGNADWEDAVPKWTTPEGSSCASVATAETWTIYEATSLMMRVSDNGASRALQEHWGTATLNNFATSLGLTDTALSGAIWGCDPLPTPGRNETTLADLGRIYEAAVDGSQLTPGYQGWFFTTMNGKQQFQEFGFDFTGIWPTLVAMVDEEAPGMSQFLKDSFINEMSANHKGGGGGRCDNGECTELTEWLTWAGWAQFPTCEGGSTGMKQYVWGATLQEVQDTSFEAPGPSSSGLVFGEVSAEPLREQLRAALDTWGDCFPHWEVVAKVGGGNVLNPSLPDYVPETWVNKPVTIYLKCVPGSAPIKRFHGDKAVTLSGDGSFYYWVADSAECVDTLGRSAPELGRFFGYINIDRTPPICKFTPSTQYVARNTTQTVTFTGVVDTSISGPGDFQVTNTAVNGAVLIGAPVSGPGEGQLSYTVQMGSSTAGRFESVITVTDKAGNVSTCKAVVRAK